MLTERLNPVHWTWMIYTEMFLAGLAAGLMLAAFLLTVTGRGQSPTARTAHLLAFPILLLVTLLLIVDLGRPERFWHMVLMSERLLPILKPWSPISLGTWLLVPFTGICFISFLDALIASGRLSLGPWRRDRTLHGGSLGLAWSALGALFGLCMSIYAGVLLSVTNIPGWSDAPFISAVFAASAPVTGIALLVLVRSLRGALDADTLRLAAANRWLIALWVAVTLVFVLTLWLSANDAARYFLSGWPLIALLGALLLGGIVPLALRMGVPARRPQPLMLSAVLVLVGGFLLRMSIVMGPQEWIR